MSTGGSFWAKHDAAPCNSTLRSESKPCASSAATQISASEGVTRTDPCRNVATGGMQKDPAMTALCRSNTPLNFAASTCRLEAIHLSRSAFKGAGTASMVFTGDARPDISLTRL